MSKIYQHVELAMASGHAPLIEESATLRAYRVLEQLLVTLALEPGHTTTEGALIDRLALGRTPVREAVQRLSWEGLLTVRPRAGIEVAPLHAADWLRVVDARRGVEGVIARSAARHLSPRDTLALQAAAVAMHDAVLASDVLAFLQADKVLDEALARACDNAFAARLAMPLQTHSRRFWYRYQANTGLAEAAEHHVALIGKILDRDGEAAEAEAARLMDLLRGHALMAIAR
jgi:DNA-binding GntR family transcriptional regulator